MGLLQEKQKGIFVLHNVQELLAKYEFGEQAKQEIALIFVETEQLWQLVIALGQETQLPLIFMEFHPQEG